jgi:hypothetical protein
MLTLRVQAFKLVFLAWCMYPSRKFNGSIIVYEKIVKKFLVQHEQVRSGLDGCMVVTVQCLMCCWLYCSIVLFAQFSAYSLSEL